VLGVILTLLFGTFELGIIGLAQLGGDGAAYVAAHASVLGNDPNAAIQGPFPTVAQNATVSIQQSQPDTTNVPVDYNVAAQSNRHGGAQVVRPTHTQATITNAGVGMGNVLPSTTLSSAVIEANMMVSGVGFDIFGDPLNSSADFQNSKSYFNDDGNAPPYHIGFRYLFHCTPTPGQGCQGNAQIYDSGFAEYLDGSNWGLQQNGIQPGAVYGAMTIHQQVYAQIAQKLASMSFPANYDASGSVLDPNQNCLKTVNGWDIAIPPGYTVGTTSIGTYPLNPTNTSPGCS
jgi:Flp pilus assembly protein TadG